MWTIYMYAFSSVENITISMYTSLLLSSAPTQAARFPPFQVFTGNQSSCQKILPIQIYHIVQLAAEHQQGAPQFIDLLCAIVKIEELNMPLKRNQGYVMKYAMQNYQRIAYVLDKSIQERSVALSQGQQTLV